MGRRRRAGRPLLPAGYAVPDEELWRALAEAEVPPPPPLPRRGEPAAGEAPAGAGEADPPPWTSSW